MYLLIVSDPLSLEWTIGFCLRNDLDCVGWGVKLYSLIPWTIGS